MAQCETQSLLGIDRIMLQNMWANVCVQSLYREWSVRVGH